VLVIVPWISVAPVASVVSVVSPEAPPWSLVVPPLSFRSSDFVPPVTAPVTVIVPVPEVLASVVFAPSVVAPV